MPGKKLLVADDSLTIQKVIRLALSSAPGEGYDIQAVSDGNDAVQQISLFRPEVVLIDVSLPGKNAFEVKRAVNEHPDLEEVRFVLMSSAFERYDEAQAAEVGFHGKLSKPFDPANLRQVLSDVLAQVTAKRSEKTTMIPRQPVAAPTPPPASSGSRIALTPPAPTEHLPISIPEGEDEDHTSEPAFEPPMTEPQIQLEPQLKLDVGTEPEDDFFEPIRPEPSAPAAPPTPASFAAPSAPPRKAATQGESDIRHLTESTIRMSGLDEMEWTVDDSAKKANPEPSYREIGEKTLNNLSYQTPAVPPLDGFRDLSGATFELDPPASDPMSGMDPFRPEHAEEAASGFVIAPPQPAQSQAPAPNNVQVMPSFSNEQIEAILKKQIEESFQKLAEKFLPEIAEKIIRQEISKMLKEGS